MPSIYRLLALPCLALPCLALPCLSLKLIVMYIRSIYAPKGRSEENEKVFISRNQHTIREKQKGKGKRWGGGGGGGDLIYLLRSVSFVFKKKSLPRWASSSSLPCFAADRESTYIH